MKTYKEVMTQLQKRNFNPVYLLCGDEPLYIDRIADYIEENVMDEADRDFNQVLYYAKDTQPAEVVASARQYPFGVDYRVVIVKEAQDWPSLEALHSYIEAPSPATILVICYKYNKLKSADSKAFDKYATVVESKKVPDYKLSEWVTTCATEHGFSIDPRSADLISEHIGNDLSRIDNEFLKMKLVLPAGSAVTPEIIEKYIGISKQYNVYELRDALANRDEAKAYRIVNAFCQNLKTNPLLVTVANLFYYYNSLLLFLLSPDKSTMVQKAIFGYNKSEAQLRREAGIASKYSQASLIKIISVLREFDARSKGIDNEAPEEDLYKEMVYRILH